MAFDKLWPLLLQGAADTVYMTLWASLFSYALGLPLGVLLVVTRRGHILPAPTFNTVLGWAINFLRSIPFIILLAMLFPITRAVMGRAIGTRAIIFPLIVSAFPYIARMVEGSLDEIDHGVLEAAQSMGSTNWQIIRKVLLPEAVPSLINGAAISVTTILAYTAMASAAGGGGLGALAITKGYQQQNMEILYASSLALVLLVQLITVSGTRFTKWFDHRKK
ncbi:MAG: methionine ABC transporter permease [Candidatus Limiplasma sp.]|nr:methionine ABC transporter permease [Candidatus Limiplasma sp.]MEA5145473.1 methionine ABC transporter permease [Candidatus Limiplasma sp.]